MTKLSNIELASSVYTNEEISSDSNDQIDRTLVSPSIGSNLHEKTNLCKKKVPTSEATDQSASENSEKTRSGRFGSVAILLAPKAKKTDVPVIVAGTKSKLGKACDIDVNAAVVGILKK